MAERETFLWVKVRPYGVMERETFLGLGRCHRGVAETENFLGVGESHSGGAAGQARVSLRETSPWDDVKKCLFVGQGGWGRIRVANRSASVL